MKKFFKWFLIFALAVMALIGTAIVVIPLVFNVDNYRPELVRLANERINGELQVGKLTLSLWGQILIRVDGVSVVGADQDKVLSVQDAYFYLPLLSVLKGSPELVFRMTAPEILVSKNKDGTLNVQKLLKNQKKSEDEFQTSRVAQVTVPAVALKARLGIEVKNGKVVYSDDSKKFRSEIGNLNVTVQDISLLGPIRLKIWADVDTQVGGLAKVSGPVSVKSTLRPRFHGTDFEGGDLSLEVDLGEMRVLVPGLLEKKKGVRTRFVSEIQFGEEILEVQSAKADFHNAEIQAQGKVFRSGSGGVPSVDLKVSAQPISLSEWKDLLPVFAQYVPEGQIDFEGSVQGPSDALKYHAVIRGKGVSVLTPALKHRPEMDFEVTVVPDQIKKFETMVRAPGLDLRMSGQVLGFGAPQVTLNVESTGMDLDQIVDFSDEPSAGTSAAVNVAAAVTTATTGGTAAVLAGGKKDYDSRVKVFRQNPYFQKTKLDITTAIKFIQAKGIQLDGFSSKTRYSDAVMNVESYRFGIHEGTVSGKFRSDFKSDRPTYTFSVGIQNLDLKTAASSHLEMLKNTFIGKLNFSMEGKGTSFNRDLALDNLSAKGKFSVSDGAFATVDVAKITVDAINRAIEGASSKVPALSGKRIENPPGQRSGYRSISANFTISNGQFLMPNFKGEPYPNAGVHVLGTTEVGLKDQSLKASWRIVDTYNLTRARDLSVTIEGTQIPHILARRNDPVSLPVSVGCQVKAPCYDYAELPEHFGKIALENVGVALKGRIESEVRKEAEKKLEQIVPPEAKDAVKELRKRLGF